MHMELKRKFEFDINSAVKIGVTVLIVAVLIISAKLLMDYNEAVRERELKERIIAELELQRDELEYEYNLEFDRDYVIRIARRELGLALPQEINYFYDYGEE
jgi:cell division protein FtsB